MRERRSAEQEKRIAVATVAELGFKVCHDTLAFAGQPVAIHHLRSRLQHGACKEAGQSIQRSCSSTAGYLLGPMRCSTCVSRNSGVEWPLCTGGLQLSIGHL